MRFIGKNTLFDDDPSMVDEMKLDFLRENWSSLTLEKLETLV